MPANNSKSTNDKPSEAYLIEKEKQKTIRSRNMYMFFGIIILSSLFALYIMLGSGGKGSIDVDVTDGKFKFSVDKPVVEQAKTETKPYKTPEGKVIDFTIGTISQEVLNDFGKENISFSPNLFVGENLINATAGYIVSSSNPGMWNIQYNPAGLSDPLTAINSFQATDGSHMLVTREPVIYSSIEDYVEAAITVLFNYGVITDYPNVSFANDGKTAFLTFTNITTNGQSYMKVVEGYSHYYIATANYNLDYTGYTTQEALISMVANFTLIE